MPIAGGGGRRKGTIRQISCSHFPLLFYSIIPLAFSSLFPRPIFSTILTPILLPLPRDILRTGGALSPLDHPPNPPPPPQPTLLSSEHLHIFTISFENRVCRERNNCENPSLIVSQIHVYDTSAQ